MTANLTAAATPPTQSGVVTRVVDGDTVWVKTSASAPPLKVRIQGIDAPEICQPGGLEAQKALKNRVMGQRVSVTSSAHDAHGRSVATLRLNDADVGRWLVAGGHAWVYSFRGKQGPYAAEFSQAQTGRRGVFSLAGAQEPRAFRRAHGSCNDRAKKSK